MRIFQLQGFELADGRHVARLAMTYEDDPARGTLQRSSLWAAEEGQTGLVASLALPSNNHVLLTLAGVPYDSKVEWTIREVGRDNAMDLVALVRRARGGNVLLLIACTESRATPARLREHAAQSVRTALSTLAKMSFSDAPAWTRLVLISQWRDSVPVPTEAKPLPALQRKPWLLESVPEPQVWGYLPYVRGTRHGDVHVAFGHWSEFDVEPWTSLSRDSVPVPQQEWVPVDITGYGEGAAVELEQYGGGVRVSLRLKSSQHRAAMKQDRHGSYVPRRLRALRSACYSGHVHVGAGRFVGETIEGGVPRLHWDWADGQAPSATAARDLVIKALTAFDVPTKR
ncbi:MAG TPA: hypothetical protein VFB62_28635 [Polyangiaceae bacterium]|nr:hypothetical protein [Polyangiaceae bacterium]